MIHRTFILAYSIDNQNIAQEIDNHLSKVNIGVQHVIASHETTEDTLQNRLKNAEHFIFLLISDNFLKNANAMNRGMFMLQDLVENKKAHPIIIDGRHLVEGSTPAYIAVPTLYDRMTHVIKYMNFWQDKYLDLRRLRRDVPDEGLASFDEQLKVVRAISSEMGEFLKNLRTYNAWRYEDFSANNFELFFNEINRTDLHEELKLAVRKGEVAIVKEDLPPTPESHFTAPPIVLVQEKNPIPEVDLERSTEIKKVEEKLKEDMSTFNAEPKTIDEILQKEKIVEPNPTEKTSTEPVEPISIPKSEPEPEIELDEIIKNPPTETVENNNIITKEEIDKKVNQSTEKEVVEIFSSRVSADNVEEATDIQEEEDDLKKKGKKPLLERLIEYREGKKPDSNDPLQPTSDETVFELSNNTNAKNNTPIEDTSIYDGIFGDDIEEIESQSITEESESDENDNIKILSPKIPFGTNEIEPEKYFDWHQKRDEAVLLINSGKIYAGLNVLRSAVDQDQNNASLRLEYAIFLMDKAESYKAAQRELEKVVQLEPNNKVAFKKLGIVAEKREDFLFAKNCFEKAASLDENDLDIFYRLGILVSTKFNDLQDQAVDYFKKAIKTNYNNVDAHYRLGVLLDENFQKPKKAARQFELTLELDHNHPFANYDLAILHHQFGQFQKAADYYARACEINPVFKSEENDRAFLSALRKEAMESLFEDMPDEETWFEREEKKEEIIEEPKPKGKVVFITGSTSGIGKATAELFAKNGYSLILNGRRKERLDATCEEFVKEYDADILLLPFDVRNPADANEAYNSLPTAWQDIDILINNAGLAKGFEPIHEGKLEDWNTMIDTNIKGLLFMTRMISPNMVKRRTGHIINVCSTAGHEAYPNGAVYCATKYAVDALTKGMRLDLYKHNLKVSQVSPAHVEETEFARVRFDWDEDRAKIYEDFQPLKSSDVAAVIYFMASQPDHVNIQDVLMMGKQQANSTNIDRSGRK